MMSQPHFEKLNLRIIHIFRIDFTGLKGSVKQLSKRIAIIGAGITGLSSAYFIKSKILQ